MQLSLMSTWPATRYSLLARLADASDAAAWAEFQGIYESAVYRYARNRGLGDADALDVVQDVMIAAHKSLAKWQPSNRNGSFRAWLAETMRRVTLQTLRQVRRFDQAVGGSDCRAAVEAIASSSIEMLDDELREWRFYVAAAEVEHQVHETTWRAFWLTAVDGLSPHEASTRLGLSVGSVYTAKCRVLDRIRRRLSDSSEEK